MGEQFLLAFLGQPLWVFDHVAIHVGDPEGTVRTGSDHDGTAPAVFAGEEVGSLFRTNARR